MEPRQYSDIERDAARTLVQIKQLIGLRASDAQLLDMMVRFGRRWHTKGSTHATRTLIQQNKFG